MFVKDTIPAFNCCVEQKIAMSPNVRISVGEVSTEVCLQSLAQLWQLSVWSVWNNGKQTPFRTNSNGLLGSREHSKQRENSDSYRVLCFRLRVKPRVLCMLGKSSITVL